MKLPLLVVVLSGVLAAASPGCLERVEMYRVQHLGGELAGPGVVRLAVEDCRYLGLRGVLVTGDAAYPVHVTDCQQAAHRAAQPMHERGLVADTDAEWLDHETATIVLWANDDD